MAGPDRRPPEAPGHEARDVMAFGQEIGRVLSDDRIIGRAEPFAKVFPSSRAVKRAVGLVAWAVLEDIALDAWLDERGRLVADTNVRRIAASLGVSKNTVTQHLARLREFGFVLREELREQGNGRYELSRYVLDPSACIERFTITPPVAEPPPPAPRPRNWDTGATVSQSTCTRELGQNNKTKTAADNNNNARAAARETAVGGLAAELAGLGLATDVAEALVARHPPELVAAALYAARGAEVRHPAGYVVAALRDGWAQVVSAALDDRQLARAVAALTVPVVGLERRSLPPWVPPWLVVVRPLLWGSGHRVHRLRHPSPLRTSERTLLP